MENCFKSLAAITKFRCLPTVAKEYIVLELDQLEKTLQQLTTLNVVMTLVVLTTVLRDWDTFHSKAIYRLTELSSERTKCVDCCLCTVSC